MGSITAKVIVDSNQANAALDKLNSKLKTTSDGFSKLNSLMAGLAIGSFVKSAFDMADAMADIAQATELSIAAVSGFSKAVAASGGSIEGAQKSLLKFTENIGGAAEESKDLQNAFYQVGVSLGDLKSLTSEDLLAKTIDGLTKVTDVSARLKLQTDLLGKGFKGVNAAGVSSSYADLKAGSEASAAATKKAADAVDKFNASITTMKEQVLIALTPVIDTFNKLPIDRIAKLTGLVVQLGIAFAALKTAQGVLSGISATITATSASFSKASAGLDVLKGGLSGAALGGDSLAKTWSRLGYQSKAIFRDFSAGALTFDKLSNTTIPILGTRLKYLGTGLATVGKGFVAMTTGAIAGIAGLVGGLAMLVAQIVLVNEAVSTVTGFDFIDSMAHKLESLLRNTFPSVHKAIDDLGRKMGMSDINGNPYAPEMNKTGEGTDAPLGGQNAATRAGAEREVVDSLGKQRVEFDKILADYKDANREAFKRYDLETKLIGKSQEQQAIMQLRNEADLEYQNKRKAIQEQIDTITNSGSAIDKTLLAGLNEDMAKLTDEYNKQTAAIESQVKARMKADAQNQLSLFTDQQRVSLAESLDKLYTEAATISLPEIDRQYQNIKASAEAAAKAQIANEEARRGTKLSVEEVREYYAAATAGVNDLMEAQLTLNAAQNADKLNKFGLQQQVDLSNELQKIQDKMATMTMPEIARQEYEITAAAKARAKAEIDAEEIRRGEAMSNEERLQYYNKALTGINKLTAANRKQYEMSRSFETGWKQAMNSYIEEATNAATKAQKVFTTAFKGMEDAIVGFVKTGKFEWKSFVNDMLEQLLRSQIQGVFAGLMQSITGSLQGATATLQQSASEDTDILGVIGSLFGGGSSSSGGIGGGAQGSPVFVTNWPGSIGGGGVGGALGQVFGTQQGQTATGGGLWDTITEGASSIWDTVTDWFGGGTSSGTGAGNAAAGSLWGAPITAAATQDTSWFEDVASSVGGIADSIGDWFGGFFADGGQIPSGKIGIVGERGPEFIGGPANITPMGSSGPTSAAQQVINYFTVNTLDAQSFQTWMAQDPTYLAAVVNQGNKGMPA